jgi:hypothetical protein
MSGLMPQCHKRSASAQTSIQRQTVAAGALLLTTIAVEIPSYTHRPTQRQGNMCFRQRNVSNRLATSLQLHCTAGNIFRLLYSNFSCDTFARTRRKLFQAILGCGEAAETVPAVGRCVLRQPGGNCACADGRCRWMLYELAGGCRVCFWRWLIAQLVQIVAKLMALQAVIFIFLISALCNYSDHTVNGNLSNHHKHMSLYFLF